MQLRSNLAVKRRDGQNGPTLARGIQRLLRIDDQIINNRRATSSRKDALDVRASVIHDSDTDCTGWISTINCGNSESCGELEMLKGGVSKEEKEYPY